MQDDRLNTLGHALEELAREAENTRDFFITCRKERDVDSIPLSVKAGLNHMQYLLQRAEDALGPVEIHTQ